MSASSPIRDLSLAAREPGPSASSRASLRLQVLDLRQPCRHVSPNLMVDAGSSLGSCSLWGLQLELRCGGTLARRQPFNMSRRP